MTYYIFQKALRMVFLLWKMILFSRIDAQISMRQSLIVVLNLMILILILNGHLI